MSTAGAWHAEAWGEPGKPLIVLLHGFTWLGRAWEPVARSLAADFHVVAPDLPGHGRNPLPPQAEFEPIVRDLAAWLESLGDVDMLVGYSMGGRLALRLAQILGARVRRLVLIGASAGLATAEERETRLAVDRELADELLRDGLPAFLDRWTRLPLFDSFRDMPAERLQAWQELRSHHDPAALAGALIAMSTGAQPYLLPDLPRLHTPTTLVVGERDAKFRAIARQLAEALPRSEVVVVPGTGHSVPMERPEAIAALLTHKEPVHA